jgi:glycosyltransferase involved in cell wall biosynthesis
MTRQLRVAHLIAPAPVGGAEQVVADLTQVLASAGADVHLILTLDLGVPDHPVLGNLDPAVTIHRRFLPPKAYREEIRLIADILSSTQPNVVHTHGYRANVIGSAAARRAGYPVVSTLHGLTGSGVKIRLFQWAERWSLRRASGVIAVSSPLASYLQRVGVPDRFAHLIPNSRLPPRDLLDREKGRRELGVPSGSFHIGWIGRMSHEKAPDIMVQCLKSIRVQGSIPGLHVTMIGDGPLRPALEKLSARSDLSSIVNWPGGIPRAYRYLPAFDGVVISSRSEGTPVVALEAMTVGIPLVATRVGGIPDLVGSEGALLVPAEDPEALASAIVALYSSPERAASLTTAARERLSSVASPDEWAARHLRVYRSVAGVRKSPGRVSPSGHEGMQRSP